MTVDNRLAFARLVARDEAEIDLDVACLHISAEAYPGLRFEPILAEMDRLAARVRERVPEAAAGNAASRPAISEALLVALNDVLYVDEGYAGDRADYYDPRNALLCDVLARKRGLPITLSVLQMEVARRVGLRLHGIGFPGHFLVGAPDGTVLDPFSGGRRLWPTELRRLLRGGVDTDEDAPFPSALLRPATKHEILVRILNNLRIMYGERDEHESALWALDALTILHPTDAHLLRDRALTLARAGHFAAGAEALERYLDAHPSAPDREGIRRLIAAYRGRLN